MVSTGRYVRPSTDSISIVPPVNGTITYGRSWRCKPELSPGSTLNSHTRTRSFSKITRLPMGPSSRSVAGGGMDGSPHSMSIGSGAHRAVHHQRRAARVAALVRCQEQHGARHLLGLAVPAHRDDLVEKLGGVAANELRHAAFRGAHELVVDRPGVDRVDADTARRDLLGNAAHQADQRVLGCNVGAVARDAFHPGDARGDDDAAA